MTEETAEHRAFLERRYADAEATVRLHEHGVEQARDADDVDVRAFHHGQAQRWLEYMAGVRAELKRLDAGDVVAYADDSPEALTAARAIRRRTLRDAAAEGLPTARLHKSYERTCFRLALSVRGAVPGLTVARRVTGHSGRPRARRTAGAARAGPDDGPGEPDPPAPGDAGPIPEGAR